ncbi:MAG: hypothetical protein EA388_14445 [Nitriliruptor sp.]|nr:MAG: hypothetical protein EA388_14445 [Nitriliruptor sp.]
MSCSSRNRMRPRVARHGPTAARPGKEPAVGGLCCPAPWWHRLLVHDLADERDGAGPRTIAVLRDGGYVVYRLQPHGERDVPCGTVRVEELVSLHPQATAQLWTFLAATDQQRRSWPRVGRQTIRCGRWSSTPHTSTCAPAPSRSW